MFSRTVTNLKSMLLMLISAATLVSIAGPATAYVDKVLVILNEEVITQSEYSYRYRSVMADVQAQNTPIPPDIKSIILDGMIRDKLQVQEAKRRGIDIDDQELNTAIERYAAQQNLNVAQLEASLEASGQRFDLFKESIRDSIIISRFQEYYAQRRVVVPDYEIDTLISANKLNVDNSEYQIAHILIKNPEDNNDLAQRVRDKIDAGMSFQQAVLTYSEATDAQDGGVIGWRTPAQLPTLYLEAVEELQVGGVSQVLTSANGLHILKLLDRRGDISEIVQAKVVHILIKAESQVARAQAAKRMFELRQRILNGESFDQLARIYSDDTVSAALGGDLGWVSPGQMVKPFEEAFRQLPIGELSAPVQTQFGVHMLRVEDRRMKDVTDQIIRRRADSFLRRQRAEREYEQWVRELLEGAYVKRVSEPTI